MRYFYLLLLTTVTLGADPVCTKCEIIREHNKEHPGEFEFYEDYLKAQESKKVPSSNEKANPK